MSTNKRIKVTCRAQSIKELKELEKNKNLDILVGHKRFSRKGLWEQNFFEVLKSNIVLDFDAIIKESDFAELSAFEEIIRPYRDNLKVRVQDYGVANFFFQKGYSLELVLENGHHNKEAILETINYFKTSLKKVVLSYELDKSQLAAICDNLPAEIDYEILVAGEILLFYSPRKLVSRLDFEQNDLGFYEVKADSLESAHKNFKIIENLHGTFMYHLKDLLLLDRIAILKEMGINCFRYDSDFNLSYMSKVFDYILGEDILLKEIIESYPKDHIRGYFGVNKSDVLFKKLKNSHLIKTDSYRAKVLSMDKPHYLALKVEDSRGLHLGDEVNIISPEGINKKTILKSLKNLSGEEINQAVKGTICLIPYISKMGPKSILNIL